MKILAVEDDPAGSQVLVRAPANFGHKAHAVLANHAALGYLETNPVFCISDFFKLYTEPSRSPDTKFTEETTNGFSSLWLLCRSAVFSVVRNSSIKFTKGFRNCECYCIRVNLVVSDWAMPEGGTAQNSAASPAIVPWPCLKHSKSTALRRL